MNEWTNEWRNKWCIRSKQNRVSAFTAKTRLVHLATHTGAYNSILYMARGVRCFGGSSVTLPWRWPVTRSGSEMVTICPSWLKSSHVTYNITPLFVYAAGWYDVMALYYDPETERYGKDDSREPVISLQRLNVVMTSHNFTCQPDVYSPNENISYTRPWGL